MAVTAVQHRTTSTNGATSIALAFSSNNTANNLLVYYTGCFTGTINAATDSNTNTIANAVPSTGSSGTNGVARCDYVASAHAGANTVTAHTSQIGGLHIHIWEISGCATVSPVSDTGTVAGSSTASVSTGGTSTLTGDAVLAMFMDQHANASLTIGSGYTTSDISNDSVGGDAMLSEFKAATAGGTQTAACGGNGTDVLVQIIVTFKAAAAAFQPDEDYWIPPPMAPFEPNITVW